MHQDLHQSRGLSIMSWFVSYLLQPVSCLFVSHHSCSSVCFKRRSLSFVVVQQQAWLLLGRLRLLGGGEEEVAGGGGGGSGRQGEGSLGRLPAPKVQHPAARLRPPGLRG